MAKMLPTLGKIVDVVVTVADDRQLVLCQDCLEEMNVRSVIVAQAATDPDAISITHNLKCPACGAYAFMSLRSTHP